MNVDVSALVYKASANLSYSQDNLFRQEDATLVIRFATEYARTGMKKQKLSPEAQALLDAGDLPAFEEMCGSQMVIIERRGSMFQQLSPSEISNRKLSQNTQVASPAV